MQIIVMSIFSTKKVKTEYLTLYKPTDSLLFWNSSNGSVTKHNHKTTYPSTHPTQQLHVAILITTSEPL